MNLLVRPTYHDTDIMRYRRDQYAMIPELVQICFEYAKRFGFKYELDDLDIQITEDPDYHSFTHFSYDRLTIRINKTDKKPFLELNIPKLIDDCFFKIKGVRYVPLFYLLDEPISFKKVNINVYALFKPITIDIEQNRVVFSGNNIPISRFFRIWLSHEQEVEDYCEVLDCHYIPEKMETSIKFLSKQLNCDPDIEEIRATINKLFFDDWTLELYLNYYKLSEISFLEILKYIYDRKLNNIDIAFNDLRYKRLVFIELILGPLFREFNIMVNSLRVASRKSMIKLNLNPDAITSNFLSSINNASGKHKFGLGHRNPYDIVNGYSGILTLKTSFENPNSVANLPTQVRNIHETYKNVICPVTISNENPGTVSSLIPNITVQTRYGIIEI